VIALKHEGSSSMNKRDFLKTTTTTILAYLSYYLPGREKPVMATEKEHQFPIEKTEQQWKETLSSEEFNVLRKHGTERAGTSPLNKEHRNGTFLCAGCQSALFSSETKFDSGTGWPSFNAPLEGSVETTIDKSLFMSRVEVHCSHCGGHLGHVFNDGPKPTGKRYCMNGIALKFVPS
jgi:peptide-methionine (R)-S-oxide reductase